MNHSKILMSLAAAGLVLMAAPVSTANVPSEVVRTAAGLGITAESLTVAGMTSSLAAEGVLLRLEQAEQLRSNLLAARAAANTAGQAVSDLTTAVSLEPENGQLVALYEAAVVDLEQAQQQIGTVRDQLLAIALDTVSSEILDGLAAWRSASGYAVPPEFRIAERTEEQWKAIEAALRAEHRAERTETTLAPAHAQLLASVRSETEVLAAQHRLSIHLYAIELVFLGFSDP